MLLPVLTDANGAKHEQEARPAVVPERDCGSIGAERTIHPCRDQSRRPSHDECRASPFRTRVGSPVMAGLSAKAIRRRAICAAVYVMAESDLTPDEGKAVRLPYLSAALIDAYRQGGAA